MLDLLWITLGVVFLVATLLPLLRTPTWYVRIFDFPRLQIAGLGVIVLAGFAATSALDRAWEWMLLVCLGAAAVYQGARVLPYTPLFPKEVERAGAAGRERLLRLMISNVLMTSRDAEGLRAIVDEVDPDVLLLVETDAWWAEQMTAYEAHFPHRVMEPRDNTYGMLLYSRLPLHAVRVEHLVQDDVPSIFATAELRYGDAFDLVCVHPRPPRPLKRQDADARDAELVLVGRRVAERTRPVVVAGDFNDVAWSYTTRLFQRLGRLLDPRRGRGFFSTFHAHNPLLRYPLDHVFHSEHFRLARLERLPAYGSDHFPILVELACEPSGAHRQDPPEPDADDADHAREAVEEADDVGPDALREAASGRS